MEPSQRLSDVCVFRDRMYGELTYKEDAGSCLLDDRLGVAKKDDRDAGYLTSYASPACG
jgi:hypothetical protein